MMSMDTGLRTDQFFPGSTPELVEKLARAYGKGEKPFMLGQGIFKRQAVVDNDIVIGKEGLGKMPAVFTTVYHDLVAVAVKLDI